MNSTELKMFYTAQELADLQVPCLPKTRVGILRQAQRLNWIKRERNGRGGGVEYSLDSLSIDAQNYIKEQKIKSLLHTKREPKTSICRTDSSIELDIVRQCPAILENKTAELNETQRSIADARCALVQEVFKLESEANLSRIKAVTYISEQSKAESLPEHLQQSAELANAKKGKRVGVGVRMLNQWVVDYLKAKDSTERLFLLAPGKYQPQKPEDVSWLPDYLAIYRSPNGINMKRAYKIFCAQWTDKYQGQDNALLACPSYDAVVYAMKKLPVLVKEKFRTTGSEWRSLNPYIRRNWEAMPVNGVWVGDGHNMKLDVAHPIHGRPFSPEITLVTDSRTRYLVGWSLSLSENAIAVADALRHAMERNGRPLIYYSDNGGGETNKMLDADITGILPRLGVQHETGIPGNPQGRGIIERLNKEVPSIIAQQFETYHGEGADNETVRITKRAVQSAINAHLQGKELTTKQQQSLRKLPSWAQLLEAIEREIEYYNNHHEHRGLPKNPKTGKHYTPAEYRNYLVNEENHEIDYLSTVELRDMFRPQLLRKVERGQVQLFNNVYFAIELANYHGDEVAVAYDIHEPNFVIIRDKNGAFICNALWNGNQRDAFPKAVIETLQEKRAKGRIKRAQDKIDEANAELTPAIESNANVFDFSSILQPKEDKEPLFVTQADREKYYRDQKKHTEE